MKTQYLFRLAAGPRIGFGHLMRCRALARALGVRPIVSIRGGSVARRQAEALGCIVTNDGPLVLRDGHVLIVDDPSPAHARGWLLRAAREGVATATIHDRGIGSRAADLIVDGSITRTPVGLARALCGTRFTVLDRRVLAARAARRRRGSHRVPRRVLIALGGGSHVLAAARSLVDAIVRRCSTATIDVATGLCGNTARPSLGVARWIERPDGLAADFAACDVAVVGGGVTLYEACAIGVPVVALAVVAGQRPAVAGFAARGAAIDAGSLAAGKRAIATAAAAVAQLLADSHGRRRRESAARNIVDGQGARRVASRIRTLARRGASGGRPRV